MQEHIAERVWITNYIPRTAVHFSLLFFYTRINTKSFNFRNIQKIRYFATL